ncbi:MAG TPA: PH domain-containing protein [Acidimicrobiales bacterium]|jgi:putative membrane protein
MTPVARAGRIVPLFLLAFVVSSGGQGHSNNSARVYYAIAILVVGVAGFVHWLVTKWTLDGATLRIESGLLRRDARQLPVARIQAVDVVRPFVARLFGLAELRIRLAGSSSSNGRLAYLSDEVATDLRARLLATHHGVDPNTPEPAQEVMTKVPTDRLVGSVLLSGGIVFVPLVIAVVVLVNVSPTAAVVVGSAFVTYGIGFVQGVWRRISSQYGFTVADAPDGIHISRGLLSTVSETIPVRRVQAVRLVEPLVWRLFRWCRLEVDVAGGAGREAGGGRSATSTKALLPVGSHELARQLIATVMPYAQPTPSPPPPPARLKAPLSFHFLAAGHNDVLAVAVTGRLRRTTTWVPLVKAQSLRRIQGPFQRRFGLATVHLDAAGRGVRAEFRDRAVEEADALIDELAALSRAARQEEERSRARPTVPVAWDRPGAHPGNGAGPLPPAGWFADPAGRHDVRFWDGARWTAHVRDQGVASTDPS